MVHEIGKARTTVVCDRNNLHEARQRRRNGYGMHLCTMSRDTWIRVDRAVHYSAGRSHAETLVVCSGNSRYIGDSVQFGTTTRGLWYFGPKVRQQMTSASASRT
jgi:gluconate kinase